VVQGRSEFTLLSGGAEEIVSSGGSAGATVLEGGYELVASGGIMSGAFISAGTLELTSGANATIPSEVAFAGSGTLLVDGGTSFGWHVAGFGAGDQIDLAGIAFVPPSSKKNQNAQVSYTQTNGNQSGTLTVTDGVNTANIQLLGQYMASEFTAASDGHGGTLINFTSATLTTGGNGHDNAIASPMTS
jgi:autotransporter passenger strand-loop-strand repeat protein